MRRLAAVTLALVAAGVAFAVYRSHHSLRVNTHGPPPPVGVLVAKKEIPKGTTVNAIRQAVLYRVAAIRPSQALTGAIVNPAALAGKVALVDIPPGAQLTVADFGSAVTLTSYPGGWLRAVTLTSPKEIGGRVEVGSRVDVLFAGSGKVREFARNMEVLLVTAAGRTVTLKSNLAQAGKLIYLERRPDRRLILRVHQ